MWRYRPRFGGKFHGLLLVFGLGLAPVARANWTLNLGYHNPLASRYGLNFLYWGTQWNFELGVGWFDAKLTDTNSDKEQDKDTVSSQATGDLNLKYRLSSGAIAPYIQLGLGLASGVALGKETGAGLDLGGPFAGVGLMLGKPSFYAYGAWNMWLESKNQEGQIGIGFDIGH